MHKKPSLSPVAKAPGAVAGKLTPSRGFSSAAALLAAMLASNPAHAANLYWDTNGVTAGSGAATGTWGTSAFWTTDSTGVSATSATTTTTADNLFFSAGTNGTTGTVTVSGTQAANSITFDDPVAVTISGGTAITLGGGSGAGIFQTGAGTVTNTISNALTLNGSQAWTNSTSGSTLAISGTVTRNTGAAVNFTPTGTINLTGSGLANSNGILGGWATVGNAGTAGASGDFAALDGSGNVVTYSGYTNITGSTNGSGATAQNWKVTNAAASLTASATVNSLVLTTDFNIQSGATMTLGSGGLILSGASRWLKNNGAGSTAGTGQLTSGLASGELFIDSSGLATTDNDWRIWTKVVDNGGTAVKLVKTGPGYLRLANSNSYTGGTIVNSGTLVGDSAGSFGAGAVQVNSGASLSTNLNAGTMANNFTIATGASVTIDNATNNGTLNGSFSGGGTVTIQNTSAANLSENVGGSWSGFTGTLNYNTATKVVNIFAPASMDLSNAAVNFANTGNITNSSFRTSGTTKFGSLAGFGYLDVVGTAEVGNLNTNTTFSGIIRDNGGAGLVKKLGTGTLTLSGANTNTGGAAINGGTLALGSSGALGTTGSITFGGGALQYSASNTTDYSARIATGTSAGAVAIDTNNQAITFATALTANQSGGLTKSGAGTLTLTANNLLTGTKTISGGTVVLSGSGALNGTGGITVNGSGAKFVHIGSTAVSPTVTLTQGTIDGTGTINTVNVASLAGNIIANGNGGSGTLTIGALTFAGSGTINVKETNTTKSLALTSFTTANTGTGEITINAANSSAWSLGSYDLITFTSFTGTLADFTKGTITGLSGRQSATLGTSSTALTLAIAGDTPVWTGVGSQTWTTATTNDNTGPNAWALKTGHTGTNFWVNDAVEFNDTYDLGSGGVTVTATTVEIVGGVAPTSTIFNNSSVDYTITSNDFSGITAGSVVKNGTGSVTMDTTNTYTGGTTINAGKVIIANGTLGSGTVALAGGALDLNGNALTTGAVTISAPAASGNTIIGSGGTLTPSSLTATHSTGNAVVSANVAGSGAVTMSGTGTLTLAGTNTYSGGTFAKNGTTVIRSAGGLPSTGTVTLGDSVSNTSGLVQLGDSNGAVNATVGGLATAGTGTANAVVGGNASISTLTINSGSAISYGGLLGGAGTNQNNLALAKSGSGTLTLSAANTYTGGTTVNAGTLALGSNTAAGSGTITLAGGTLTNSTGITTANAINVTSASTLLISGNNWDMNGNLTGSGNLTYSPSGFAATLALTGDNSGYTGKFTQSATANNALNLNSASVGSAAAAWEFNNNTSGRTRFAGFSGTIHFGSLAGSNAGIINNTAGTVTVSAGALNTDTTFSGAFISGTGAIALTKVGTGTLTLSGANTYTGATTVSAGTLQLGSATTLSSATGGVSVNGGTLSSSVASTTLGGNLTLAGGSLAANGASAGTIVLAANKNFSMTLGTFTFSLGDTVTGSGTGTFAITGGTFDLTNSITDYSLTYTIFSGFNSGSVAGLTFTDYDSAHYVASLANSGVLSFTSAIPEPGTYAAIFGALTLAGAAWRRRRRS